MGAFSDGFKMGGGMYNTAMDQQRQQVLDDRATEEYGQKQDAFKRQLGIQAKTDEARTRIEGLNGGVFEGSQANFGINDGVAPQGPMPQEAYQAPSVGLQSRKATDTEYNRAFQSEALARGDMAGLQALRVTGKGFEYDDAYKNAGAKWDAMSDAEKADTIKKVSYDQSIPGHGNWVEGTGKTAGYMNYMPPGADPVKLSAKDTKEFFSITNAMEVDPSRARKELESASASVRAIAKEVFASTAVGVKENNNTQDSAEKRDIEREKLGIYRQSVAQAGRSSGGSSDKKDDPKDIAALNALQDAYANEPDRTKQEGLRRQYNSLTNKMATLRGKTVPLREDRASGETDPTKYYGAVKAAVESGIYKTPQEAQMAVDAAYGRGPGQNGLHADENASLTKQNARPEVKTKPASAESRVAVARTKLGMPNSNEPVPEPPQQYRNVGLTRVANPDFQNWQQMYGAEYERQQAYAPTVDEKYRAGMDASRSAAQVAPSGHNPYIQNRVR